MVSSVSSRKVQISARIRPSGRSRSGRHKDSAPRVVAPPRRRDRRSPPWSARNHGRPVGRWEPACTPGVCRSCRRPAEGAGGDSRGGQGRMGNHPGLRPGLSAVGASRRQQRMRQRSSLLAEHVDARLQSLDGPENHHQMPIGGLTQAGETSVVGGVRLRPSNTTRGADQVSPRSRRSASAAGCRRCACSIPAGRHSRGARPRGGWRADRRRRCRCRPRPSFGKPPDRKECRPHGFNLRIIVS